MFHNEDFFGALATRVNAGNWVAKDTPALVARIQRCVREFPLQVVHTPVNKLQVSTTREVKNKSELKFLKKYTLRTAQLIFFYFFLHSKFS